MIVKFPGDYRPTIPNFKLSQCADCEHSFSHKCKDILEFLTGEIHANDTGECPRFKELNMDEFISRMVASIAGSALPALGLVGKK